jgi:hypothetical protein
VGALGLVDVLVAADRAEEAEALLAELRLVDEVDDGLDGDDDLASDESV